MISFILLIQLRFSLNIPTLSALSFQVRLYNSFNSFVNLAYYQYVENVLLPRYHLIRLFFLRKTVYDEDAPVVESTEAEEEKKELTLQEVDAVIVPKFTGN